MGSLGQAGETCQTARRSRVIRSSALDHPYVAPPRHHRTIAAGNGEQDVVREQRRLAAIVAADVVGYSRLMGRDEAGTVARLRQVRAERLQPVPGVWSRNLKRRCRLTKRTSGSPNTPRTNSSGRKPANRYPSDRRRRRFRSLPTLQRDKNPRRSKSRKRIRVCATLAGAQARLNGRVWPRVLGLGEELVYGDFYLRWQVAMCLGEVFNGA